MEVVLVGLGVLEVLGRLEDREGRGYLVVLGGLEDREGRGYLVVLVSWTTQKRR